MSVGVGKDILVREERAKWSLGGERRAGGGVKMKARIGWIRESKNGRGRKRGRREG